MSSEYTPAHGPRSLAARTIVAVVSTVALAVSVAVAALELPSGLVRAFQGPISPLTSLEVVPAEPDRVVVCMGPTIAFSGQDAAPVGYGEATEDVLGTDVTSGRITDTDLSAASSLEAEAVSAPPAILSQPAQAGPLAGVSSQELDNPNVRGLALQECQEPRVETWLVGGDTTTGRQAVVTLSNPGAVAASVDVDVWGESGPISSPLGQGIVVGPGAQRVVSLAGLAPAEARPVLRVVSNGTGIVAALHTTIIRGLNADGLAVVTGQATPSTLRVITGLYGPPEDIIGPILGKEGYSDVGGLVRVLSPDAPTTVSVTVVRPATANVTTRLELAAGQVGDLSLDQFGQGDYSLVLESSEPIVAAVRHSVGTDERTDTSWVGSSYAVTGDTGFVVPARGETRLSVVNPVENEVVVSIDGRPTPIGAGDMIVRSLGPGSYLFSSDGPVYAVVSARTETLLGHSQVLPGPKAGESIVMTIR
jgi:hypothetical protein